MTRAAATLPLAFCLLLAGPVLRAEGANLNVTVHNLKNAEGQVIIAVFDSKENYLKKPVDERALPITDELTGIAEFTDLTPGTYAVVAYHDKNENKDLDRLVVVPREAYGFSNDARGMFGPARFKSAAIEVGEEDMAIEIKAK
jgi:uncharacterized protein (DUF2141 family)